MLVHGLVVTRFLGCHIPLGLAPIVAVLVHYKGCTLQHTALFGHQHLHQLVVGEPTFEVHSRSHERREPIVAPILLAVVEIELATDGQQEV